MELQKRKHKQDFQQFTENQIGNSNNSNIDSNGAIRKSRTMAKFKDNEGFNNQLLQIYKYMNQSFGYQKSWYVHNHKHHQDQ